MVADADWWAVAWQSAPAHLREAPRWAAEEGSAVWADGAAAGAAVVDEPVVPARPRAARPRPIWHAVSASRRGRDARRGGEPGEGEPDKGDLDRLGVRIRGMAADLAADLAAPTCEWLRLIEQSDRRKGWAGVGIASCAAWLSWTCSISPATAREYLRVARSLPLIPLISAAFAAGELSYSKARVLVTVAAEVDESVLLAQARAQTVSQLERTVRAFRHGDGWAQQQTRRAMWRWDDDGMLVLSARLPPAEGALVLAALEQAREREGAPTKAAGAAVGTSAAEGAVSGAAPSEVISAEATRADMLVALAERSLCVTRGDSSGNDRNLLVVHVDAERLVDVPTDLPTGRLRPRCHVENGPGLDHRTARRIACDAALVAVIHHVGEGEPLRLGRKTRAISAAQRRALRIRDGGCRFPGCHRRTHPDAHHVRPWSLFGPTDLDNLVLLCRFHHMLVHEGGFTVSAVGAGPLSGDGNAGGWIFRDPDGELVPVVPLVIVTGNGDGARASLVRAVDPGGLLPGWRGEPFHLIDTVGALAGSPRREALVAAGVA